jgi:hypothetical protein
LRDEADDIGPLSLVGAGEAVVVITFDSVCSDCTKGPFLPGVRVGPFFVAIGVGDTLVEGSGQLSKEGREGSIKYVGETGSTVSTNLNECRVIISFVTGL